MLVRHGPRALLYLFPGSMRARALSEGPRPTPRMLRVAEALEGLGFQPLGHKGENGPLGGIAVRSDVFVNEIDGAYADLFLWKGSEPYLYFLSPFPDGALILTA